jgi:hypothetical protein
MARTPRSGIALTHRLLVLFSGDAPPTAGWAGPTESVRAAAEPMLNAWAAKLMGDPRKVRCVVGRLDEITGTVVEPRTLPLSELQLAPLDMVYGVDAQSRPGQLSEIEQRLLYHVQHKAEGFPATARLEIQHTRPPDLSPDELTFLDVLEQASGIRRLLAIVRAAEITDLMPPERGVSGTLQLGELDDRVKVAEAALKVAQGALDALVRQGTAAESESLRTALLKLTDFGFMGAIPASASGDDEPTRARLLMQATALAKEIKARGNRGAELRDRPLASTPEGRRDQAIERMQAVFGASFVALPRFARDGTSGQANELADALAASTQVQDGDELQVYTWFTRCERVRDAVSRLGWPLRGAEVLATGEKLRLSVAQMPLKSSDSTEGTESIDRWVGLAPLPGKNIKAGKLSLVVQSDSTFNANEALTGLMIDEWVEVVPSRSETTAIAFQYNPPNTCAPQNVLLAVPPVPGKPWTVSDLHRVLVETLDLAKLRTIDTEMLGELAHYVPALFFAFNAEGDAVSTDFAPLTR